MDAHKEVSYRLSPKLYVLHSHLDFFKSKMGAYSEVHREHQDIPMFEKRYKGEYNTRMIGDYIWGLVCKTKPHYVRNAENLRFISFSLHIS